NPKIKEFAGKAIFTFNAVGSFKDSVSFYTPGMTVSSAELNNMEIEFRIKENHTIFYIKDYKKNENTISIEYTSSPTLHCNIIGWDDPENIKRKQIWAHRPYGWIPYKDDRLTMDLFITFDSLYKVFSNGIRIAKEQNNDGTTTWNYRMKSEHPFFSTALVIGDYKYKSSETGDGLPLELWYYPEWEDFFESTYRYMAEMIGFFEDEFGHPYPYELYRQAPVTDYTYGAMETTTSTVFGDYLFVDPRAFWIRNYINVNAHELAHQWFGDCISHLMPCDVWLTESFATYYAKMFEKHIYGEDHYQNVRLTEWEETMEASRINGYSVGHSRGGRARWYPKGSLVMDMLRDVLGEEDFLASISHYMNNFAFTEAETNDFIRSVYYATGRDLTWFFNQWILRGGEPHYKVSYQTLIDKENNDQTVVTVRQIH
ncbi:MAG: hypothetical protein K8R53_07730, partial [Bacteroidales bacterium]|nr:hypothetical protein [Bacteroidales bacterium]